MKIVVNSLEMLWVVAIVKVAFVYLLYITQQQQNKQGISLVRKRSKK